jgi:hypothetical protein
LPTFAVSTKDHADVYPGFVAFVSPILLAGLDVRAAGFATLVWLANPAYWAATWLAVTQRELAAAVLGIGAIMLGGLLLVETNLLIGYYVWMNSFLVLEIAITCYALRKEGTRYLGDE